MPRRRRGWLWLGAAVLTGALLYAASYGEAITVRATESQPVTRSPIESSSESNTVYVLKPGEEAEVIQCEEVKRPVILVRVRSGATGYLDYGIGRFALDRQRMSLRLLASAPNRITFSCWGMFRAPAISG
jgi:hypothetical protein